jgi:hypothetical protein
LDANPGRRRGKPATNRLSYGTALYFVIIIVIITIIIIKVKVRSILLLNR